MKEFNTDAFFDIIKSETPALYMAEVGQKIQTDEDIRIEWLKKRRGKFTASEIHRLMANGKSAGELSSGTKTYCMEKAVELMTEFDPDEARYISPAMAWGIAHEHEAVSVFMYKTGINLRNHGREQVFIELGPDAGGTPDAVYPGGGLEIKCPNSMTHLSYFEIKDGESLKSIEPKYYWQVTMLMLALGASQWHFESYDPRFIKPEHRQHIALIESNQQDLDRLVDRLDKAIKYRDEIIMGLNW